jgi:hypothetical protein
MTGNDLQLKLYSKTGQEDTIMETKRRKWEFFGHSLSEEN